MTVLLMHILIVSIFDWLESQRPISVSAYERAIVAIFVSILFSMLLNRYAGEIVEEQRAKVRASAK